ncbi:hypothetical protein QD461_33815 [Rhizobium sp. BR 314]
MAELEAQGCSRAAVTWGGNQRAADDGVDVEVASTNPIKAGGYVLAPLTAFQVKAEKFPASKITGEMKPEPANTLRRVFDEIAAGAGAYVIVSTQDDVSKKFMAERTKAMADALVGSPHVGKVTLAFYDAQKMADWASAHPTVAIWLRSAVGKPLRSWKSYGAWAHGETDESAEFLFDKGVRIYRSGRDGDLSTLDAVNELRKDLPANLNIRIVGLSGVGKTRLVQALFDDRIGTTPFFDAPIEEMVFQPSVKCRQEIEIAKSFSTSIASRRTRAIPPGFGAGIVKCSAVGVHPAR